MWWINKENRSFFFFDMVGGLLKILVFGIGVCVIFIKNLDVFDELVNLVVGIVKGFFF